MNKKQKRAKASQNNAFALLLYILYKIYALFIMHYSLCIIHYSLYQLLTRFLPASILRKIKRSIVKPHNELPP